MTDLIHAEFIASNGSATILPDRLGFPRADQLRGSERERLVEIAGRVCYDSFGKGRDSLAYHRHIIEVGHLSVLEHCVFTATITPAPDAWLPAGEFDREKVIPLFLNRPGVYVTLPMDAPREIRVTINARAILEWDAWTVPGYYQWPETIRAGLFAALAKLCPEIAAASGKAGEIEDALQHERETGKILRRQHERVSSFADGPRLAVNIVDPITPDESWATLLLCGSRGMSHELVRHGDFTAISQRSTRYVDESEGPWVEHPLIGACHDDGDNANTFRIVNFRDLCEEAARRAYAVGVEDLETWLVERGVDKLTARKQARGAARGFLGNALYTEVVFSASIAQWRRMIRARASAAADAEIRAVFVKALRELRAHGVQDLHDFEIQPSPDGIGEIAVLL